MNPLSFRILYFFTRIAWWGSILITAIIGGIAIYSLIDGPPDNVIGISSSLSFFDNGKIHYLRGDEIIPARVLFKDGSVIIPMNQLSGFSLFLGLFRSLFYMFCIMFITHSLNSFMRNVMAGKTFQNKTISFLRRTAYGFLSLEILLFLNKMYSYFYIQYNFQNTKYNHTLDIFSILSPQLILALAFWALAHIFTKGQELEDEQKLTV